jgi:3-phenylpropionate/trans-cinnamate dioxygenase ferredoxin reductase subunit
VVIIGGGYIGLEAAAVLTRLGKRVTVVEVQHRLLSRVTSDTISQFIAEQHRAYAVDIRLRKPVDRLEGSAGRVNAVFLSDGTKIATDLVVVGIGIYPSVQPLLDAGAAGDGDVFVDETCQTSIDDVFAVGDCANHANVYAGGRRLRLESVQNATDQAEVVASNIAGIPARYAAIPWFWSNQYDIRLQSIGLLQGYDDLVVRGDPASKKFSVVYLRDSHVIALDCVNSAKDFIESRKLIGAPAATSREQFADQRVSLKSTL